MALPTSRDFDAVDGGPLPHTTVNNIQDSIVNLEAKRIADRVNEVALIGRIMFDPDTFPPAILGPTLILDANNGNNVIFPLNLKIGEIFKSWKMVINHFEATTQLLRVTVIRWGGSKFPVTLGPAGGIENVPGQVATVSTGAIGDSLLTGDLSVFPLTGNETYAYGLQMINDSDASGDTIRLQQLSYVTAVL